jgi:SLT domain-containing protein
MEQSAGDALQNLIARESGGNPYAENGVYKGIGQLHYSYYPRYVGLTWEQCIGNYDIQLQAMLAYIASRYGSVENAWSFWQRNGWY